MVTNSYIKSTENGDVLVLELPLEAPRLSSTGRSYIVAGTERFQPLPVEVNAYPNMSMAVTVTAVISARRPSKALSAY